MLNHEKGAAPLYFQLVQILKEQIEHEEYCRGDLLPSEKQLMETYKISRITVRQAFSELTQSGYIRSRRGIGTEVIYEKIDEHMDTVISFTEEMARHNTTMQTVYCLMEKAVPSEKAASVLRIPQGETCYRLSRVRNVGDKPLVYTVTYLKNRAELPLEKKFYMESLYSYLREVHGIRIEHGQDTFEAALPDAEVQKRLQIDAAMPVFKRTRQAFMQGDEIFEYSVCYYPGSRYKYTVNL